MSDQQWQQMAQQQREAGDKESIRKEWVMTEEGTEREMDDYTKWKRSKDPQDAAWQRTAADPLTRDDNFKVGAAELDERMLSQVMTQLLQNHQRNIPASAFLEKVKGEMCLDGYKSILVGIGRTRQWGLAREVVAWVKSQGREQNNEVISSNWFMALAKRRVEDSEWEAATEVFEMMQEFGGIPSGETIEVFATLTDGEPQMSPKTRDRVLPLAKWLAASDAGQVLWHLNFGTPGMEPPPSGEARPAQQISIAMEANEFNELDFYGDIENLREKLKDYIGDLDGLDDLTKNDRGKGKNPGAQGPQAR